MNPSVLPESAVSPLETLPDTLVSDLGALDRLICGQLDSEAGLVRHVGEHIINAGGKRIRPILVLLVARALGCRTGSHHTLAAIIELIHTASLLHDDVVDESALRRGVESANARFGNAASVLVGDFMHTRAFQMMLSLNDMRVMAVLAETTNTIAEGEVMQLMKTRCADVDEAGYFRIIHAKTAKLFEAACMLGALAAPDSGVFCEAASAYGRALGMAFQLADDALDYGGEAASLGKNTGNDLREGKMTLPLIYLMRHGAPEQKKHIADYVVNGAEGHFEAIFHAVRQSEALQYTLRKAAEMAKTASRAIEPFPDTDYKKSLMQMCRFAVERKY